MSQPKFKIITVGEPAVGKTNIIKRVGGEKFSEKYMLTLGVDWKERAFTVGDKTVNCSIWDTAGQENYRAVSTNYYASAHACVFIFDVTAPDTLKMLSRWCEAVRNHAKPHLVSAIIGNKIDLTAKRVVSKEEGQAFAAQMGLPYYETSAKTKEGVEEVFQAVVADVIRVNGGLDAPAPVGVSLDGGSNQDAKKKKKGGC